MASERDAFVERVRASSGVWLDAQFATFQEDVRTNTAAATGVVVAERPPPDVSGVSLEVAQMAGEMIDGLMPYVPTVTAAIARVLTVLNKAGEILQPYLVAMARLVGRLAGRVAVLAIKVALASLVSAPAGGVGGAAVGLEDIGVGALAELKVSGRELGPLIKKAVVESVPQLLELLVGSALDAACDDARVVLSGGAPCALESYANVLLRAENGALQVDARMSRADKTRSRSRSRSR